MSRRLFRLSGANAGRLVGLVMPAMIALGCHDDPPSACSAGDRGCACTPLGSCDDGLVCHSQQCVSTHRASVAVHAADARACEVLFEERESTIAEIDFRSGVRGSDARRGKKVSMAFISESDTSLTGAGVEVRWLGNQSRIDVTVLDAECFDRTGTSIPGASVSIR